jgi:hypothetical protein
MFGVDRLTGVEMEVSKDTGADVWKYVEVVQIIRWWAFALSFDGHTYSLVSVWF